MFDAPMARSVSPSMTSTDAGTSWGASGRRVATTSICSFSRSGGRGGGLPAVCAALGEGSASRLAMNRPIIVLERTFDMLLLLRRHAIVGRRDSLPEGVVARAIE